MTFKDGSNAVYSGKGYKLYAQAKGGKVTGWKAIDLHGKPLTVNEGKDEGGGGTGGGRPVVKCKVCVEIATDDHGGHTDSCVYVDCSILNKAQ